MLNDLLKKSTDLSPPKTVVEGLFQVQSRLSGSTEPNQIEAVNFVALLGKSRCAASPVLAARTKTVQKEKGLAIVGTQTAPMALQTPPDPLVVFSPIKGTPIGSLEGRCRQCADRFGPSLSRRRCCFRAWTRILSTGVSAVEGSVRSFGLSSGRNRFTVPELA